MRCGHLNEDLSAYLDRELNSSEKARLFGRLKDCPECRRELDRMKALISWVQDLEDLDPPADFSKRVMARVAADQPVAVGSRVVVPLSRRSRWSLAGAAASLLVAMALWQGMKPEPQIAGIPSDSIPTEQTSQTDNAPSVTADQNRTEEKQPVSSQDRIVAPEPNESKQTKESAPPPKPAEETNNGDTKAAWRIGPGENQPIQELMGRYPPFRTSGMWRFQGSGNPYTALREMVLQHNGTVIAEGGGIFTLGIPRKDWSEFLQTLEWVGDFPLVPADPTQYAQWVQLRLTVVS